MRAAFSISPRWKSAIFRFCRTSSRRASVRACRAGCDPSAASADLGNAFVRDPSLVGDAAAGRTRAAIRAMQVEAEIRTNPELRADRFVARWQNLDRQRLGFDRKGDWQSEQQCSRRHERSGQKPAPRSATGVDPAQPQTRAGHFDG